MSKSLPHERIAVIVSDSGLLLRPYTAGPHRTASYVRVPWGKGPRVEELQANSEAESAHWESSTVIYGIVGILDLFNSSYLLVITARSDIGCVLDDSRPVYGVKAVSAIPLVRHRAERALADIAARDAPARSGLGSGQHSKSYAIPEDDNEQPLASSEQARPSSPVSSEESTPISSELTLVTAQAQTTNPNRSSLWARLSRQYQLLPQLNNGLIAKGVGPLDLLSENTDGEPELASSTIPSGSTEEQHAELENRVIRGCIREYTKGCMFFAYHFDLTRSLQRKYEQHVKAHARDILLGQLDALSPSHPINNPESDVDVMEEPSQALPLWRRVDRQFWWNESITRPFIDAGLDSYILPIVQGNDSQNPGRFVQIRGSGWEYPGSLLHICLKPPPVLVAERTAEQNIDVMKRHFQGTSSVYGPHTIVNLAEQRGKESTLCNAYKTYVNQLGNKDISYCEYDFHHETKGMKYERLADLVDQLERTFESQGYFWVSNGILLSKQKGIFRVNCIDCLDRTNVVQSTFARYVLGMQLGASGLTVPIPARRSEFDVVFNDVFSPEPLNAKLSDKFEEKVLLLSARALYIVSFDYTLEKVKLYFRVPLGMIVRITKGAYIISPLEEASRDPIQNAGFTVSWLNTDQVNSRIAGLQCTDPAKPSPSVLTGPRTQLNILTNKLLNPLKSEAVQISSHHQYISGDVVFAAFKVLPIDPARAHSDSAVVYGEPTDDLAGAKTCKEVVDMMVSTIERACHKVGSGLQHDFVVEENVVSVAEAQKVTSVYAKMEYGVKRLLWLGG
ncbi:hypothetical protein ID866_3246 [Astraeus odoratus]|nr:hypothetical protein ID866_3246 [Astraeus odoratus]